MPSRGSYQIASPEERKVARRDQSYRSCVATLLVFFMLCMVILIACVPWKKYSTSSYNKVEEKNVVMGRHYKNGYPHSEVTVTTAAATTATDASIEVFGEEYAPRKEVNQSFERYYESTTIAREFPETSTLRTISDSISTLSNKGESIDPHDRNNTTDGKVQTAQQPELRYNDTSDTTLSDNYEVSESTREEKASTTPLIAIVEVTKENIYKTEAGNIETSEYSSSTDSTPISNSSLFNQKTSEDGISTTTDITITTLTTRFSTTNSYEPFTIRNSTAKNNNFTNESLIKAYELPSTSTFTDSFINDTLVQTENTSTQETVIRTEFATEEDTSNISTMKRTTEFSTFAPTIITRDNETCSGHCKQVAAKMLSYMNHSADPCEDFYEYACGGMIADPQIIDFNLVSKAYRRIAKQMRNDNDGAASLFAKYYNSCMQYENTISKQERIALANKEINKVGKFYTRHDEVTNYEDFTSLYANLLLNYSPLLFDVAPDFDEYNSNLYTIKIGPVLHENLFDSENIDEFCHANESEIQEPFVDLESIYKNYAKCKQNKTRFINSITKALEVLEVFNGSDNIEQNIGLVTINIDKEIVEGFFSQFPPEDEIREAYLMKNYSIVSMDQLNKTTTFINWYHLTDLLMSNGFHGTNIQVYFYAQLVKSLKKLESFWKRNPMDFHNAVLGLYAQKLYHDLVISKHEDMKQHCLQVSINLLRPEASNLYMSSLSKEKIAYISRTVRAFFDELKETLKIKIQTREWIGDEERQILLTKINDLTLSVPEISYFEYEKENKFYLSDNYMHNSLILMERYRSSIYNVTPSVMNSDIPKEIWTHYATPFQTKGIAIYGLNLVVIPFGAIDYGDTFIEIDNPLTDYLIWATTGNLIARQISHHFDVNGMHYWNQTRHIDYFLSNSNGNESPFENYINCQKNNIYKDQMNMILPLTSQKIFFKISGYTLNERLSEIMGLRLTYDTMERLKLFSKYNLLPWLGLDIKQLFYLNYAQMYCTKSLLTTSYVSLHEDEELPSRIRVFVSASSENLLGRSWNCPQGSQIVPSNTCDIFPHLELKDFEIYSA